MQLSQLKIVKCPICKQNIKLRIWYDGAITEWLVQCNDCDFFKHWTPGRLELKIGRWQDVIRHDRSKRAIKNNKEVLEKFRFLLKQEKEYFLKRQKKELKNVNR